MKFLTLRPPGSLLEWVAAIGITFAGAAIEHPAIAQLDLSYNSLIPTVQPDGRLTRQRVRLEVHHVAGVVQSPGETSIAASPDGTVVAIKTNTTEFLPKSRMIERRYSTDTLWYYDAAADAIVRSPGQALGESADPSIAWGGTGRLYALTMGGSGDARIAVSQPGDNGQTFVEMVGPRANRQARCKDPAIGGGAADCGTDQPHVAADRRPGVGDFDRVYVVSRINHETVIECSVDNAQTFKQRQRVRPDPDHPAATTDMPRVAVGPDGSVYVVAVTDREGGDIMLQSFHRAPGATTLPGL
jgi:hypothetical protein